MTKNRTATDAWKLTAFDWTLETSHFDYIIFLSMFLSKRQTFRYYCLSPNIVNNVWTKGIINLNFDISFATMLKLVPITVTDLELKKRTPDVWEQSPLLTSLPKAETFF